MIEKFGKLKIADEFSTKKGQVFIKICQEELEIRNLDGQTWWANAVNTANGDLVFFEEEEETYP